MYIRPSLKSFDLENPEVGEFVEELNYSKFYDKVKDKIPTYSCLEHNCADALLHYYIGECVLLGAFLSKIIWMENENPITLQIFLAVMGMFLVAIPWLRRSI